MLGSGCLNSFINRFARIGQFDLAEKAMARREARSSYRWTQTWGPYWLPMLSFLILVTFGQSAPEAAAPFSPFRRSAHRRNGHFVIQ